MRRVIILEFIVLLSSLYAKPQKSDDYRTLYKKAENLFNLHSPTQKTDSLAASLFLKAAGIAIENNDSKIAVGSLIKTATISQTYKRLEESIGLYHRALAVNQANFNDTSLLYEAWLYLGSAFYQQGQTDSAQYYFEKASSITAFHPENNFPEQERLYNSLGAIYYESANYTQAMNYFQKALQYDDDEETRVTLQSNVANCLVQLSRYDEGINLLNSLLPSGYLKRITPHNIGHAYFKVGKYDSAINYFNKVSRKNDEVTIRLLIDLSKIYAANHEYKKAIAALDSSLNYIDALSGKIHSTDRAMNFLVRSAVAEQMNDSKQAMKWCEYAYAELSLGSTQLDINSISPVLMLDVLKQKAMLFENQYNATGREQDLEKCFNTWHQAIGVASYIRKYLDNDEAKMYFQQGRGAIFLEAIRVGFELLGHNRSDRRVNDVLSIMEAYKGTVLLENIKQATMKAGSKIPETIRETEKSLRQSISFYTVKLGTSKSSAESHKLQQQILSARVQLSRLQKQYVLHPEYDFNNEDTTETDFYEQIAARLDNNTALLSYVQSAEKIYALAITNRSFKAQVISISPALKANTAAFLEEVYHHADGKRYEGNAPSAFLYRQLIFPFDHILQNKKKWIILPDGLLNYIPFEALTSGKDSRDYLLLHKVISYHYSIALLLYSPEIPKTDGKDRISLFLAPFASTGIAETAKMPALPFSVNEVPGSTVTRWLGEKATKKNLLGSFQNARVIHFATHAASGDNSEGGGLIYLYPSGKSAEENNLYLPEIYSLDLRSTDLVILSACETAGGINSAGEGLQSLSRAFTYAGSKGMISTLWKTEDQVSAKLMQFLYAHMEDGYPPEEALQRAKQQFLKDETISEKYKTPNYWSNFIYVGRVGKNEIHLNALRVYALGLGLVGIFIWQVYKKRKLPRHSGVASVVEP